eukprot:gene11862-8150_t
MLSVGVDGMKILRLLYFLSFFFFSERNVRILCVRSTSVHRETEIDIVSRVVCFSLQKKKHLHVYSGEKRDLTRTFWKEEEEETKKSSSRTRFRRGIFLINMFWRRFGSPVGLFPHHAGLSSPGRYAAASSPSIISFSLVCSSRGVSSSSAASSPPLSRRGGGIPAHKEALPHQQQRAISSAPDRDEEGAPLSGVRAPGRVPRPRAERVAYLTDVEGDVDYLQRWVEQSKVVCWEYRNPTAMGESSQRSSKVVPAADLPEALTFVDLDTFVLAFKDECSQFVFGGDGFDHGRDLAFSRALLDFKKRFPDRVHLILGNRDLNKLVMRHIFGPSPLPASSALEGSSSSSRSADGTAATQLERLIGPRLSFPPGVSGHINPEMAEETVFPCVSGPPPKVSYLAYLQEQKGTSEDDTSVQAEPVSFLKWALIHRLGSPNAFEHRRRELWEIKKQLQARDNVATPSSSSVVAPPTDSEVAASFARAGEPGGAYYDFLLHGQLTHVIGSVLFVHGGICEDNLGVVPTTQAPYKAPLLGCRHLLDVVREKDVDHPGQAADGSFVPVTDVPGAAEAVPLPGAVFPRACNAGREDTSIPWFNALHTFKREALEEYTLWVHNRGNALRRYGNHCSCTKYSVTVNSLITPNGPSYFSLPVVHFLVMNGIRTVCVGHMPTGDTPAIIRQPPGGCVTCIAADNSYSGRGNAYCTPFNLRGKAVTAVVLHLQLPVVDANISPPPPGAENRGKEEEEEEEEGGGVPSDYSVEEFIELHGTRADGSPFQFDVRPEEPYLGRSIERRKGAEAERWWVKRRGVYPTAGGEERYAIHCTTNSYFSEQEEHISVEELAQLLEESDALQPSAVGGVLRDTETADSLRNDPPVHRIKTKVRPSHERGGMHSDQTDNSEIFIYIANGKAKAKEREKGWFVFCRVCSPAYMNAGPRDVLISLLSRIWGSASRVGLKPVFVASSTSSPPAAAAVAVPPREEVLQPSPASGPQGSPQLRLRSTQEKASISALEEEDRPTQTRRGHEEEGEDPQRKRMDRAESRVISLVHSQLLRNGGARRELSRDALPVLRWGRSCFLFGSHDILSRLVGNNNTERNRAAQKPRGEAGRFSVASPLVPLYVRAVGHAAQSRYFDTPSHAELDTHWPLVEMVETQIEDKVRRQCFPCALADDEMRRARRGNSTSPAGAARRVQVGQRRLIRPALTPSQARAAREQVRAEHPVQGVLQSVAAGWGVEETTKGSNSSQRSPPIWPLSPLSPASSCFCDALMADTDLASVAPDLFVYALADHIYGITGSGSAAEVHRGSTERHAPGGRSSLGKKSSTDPLRAAGDALSDEGAFTSVPVSRWSFVSGGGAVLGRMLRACTAFTARCGVFGLACHQQPALSLHWALLSDPCGVHGSGTKGQGVRPSPSPRFSLEAVLHHVVRVRRDGDERTWKWVQVLPHELFVYSDASFAQQGRTASNNARCPPPEGTKEIHNTNHNPSDAPRHHPLHPSRGAERVRFLDAALAAAVWFYQAKGSKIVRRRTSHDGLSSRPREAVIAAAPKQWLEAVLHLEPHHDTGSTSAALKALPDRVWCTYLRVCPPPLWKDAVRMVRRLSAVRPDAYAVLEGRLMHLLRQANMTEAVLELVERHDSAVQAKRRRSRTDELPIAGRHPAALNHALMAAAESGQWNRCISLYKKMTAEKTANYFTHLCLIKVFFQEAGRDKEIRQSGRPTSAVADSRQVPAFDLFTAANFRLCQDAVRCIHRLVVSVQEKDGDTAEYNSLTPSPPITLFKWRQDGGEKWEESLALWATIQGDIGTVMELQRRRRKDLGYGAGRSDRCSASHMAFALSRVELISLIALLRTPPEANNGEVEDYSAQIHEVVAACSSLVKQGESSYTMLLPAEAAANPNGVKRLEDVWSAVEEWQIPIRVLCFLVAVVIATDESMLLGPYTNKPAQKKHGNKISSWIFWGHISSSVVPALRAFINGSQDRLDYVMGHCLRYFFAIQASSSAEGSKRVSAAKDQHLTTSLIPLLRCVPRREEAQVWEMFHQLFSDVATEAPEAGEKSGEREREPLNCTLAASMIVASGRNPMLALPFFPTMLMLKGKIRQGQRKVCVSLDEAEEGMGIRFSSLFSFLPVVGLLPHAKDGPFLFQADDESVAIIGICSVHLILQQRLCFVAIGTTMRVVIISLFIIIIIISTHFSSLVIINVIGLISLILFVSLSVVVVIYIFFACCSALLNESEVLKGKQQSQLVVMLYRRALRIIGAVEKFNGTSTAQRLWIEFLPLNVALLQNENAPLRSFLRRSFELDFSPQALSGAFEFIKEAREQLPTVLTLARLEAIDFSYPKSLIQALALLSAFTSGENEDYQELDRRVRLFQGVGEEVIEQMSRAGSAAGGVAGCDSVESVKEMISVVKEGSSLQERDAKAQDNSFISVFHERTGSNALIAVLLYFALSDCGFSCRLAVGLENEVFIRIDSTSKNMPDVFVSRSFGVLSKEEIKKKKKRSGRTGFECQPFSSVPEQQMKMYAFFLTKQLVHSESLTDAQRSLCKQQLFALMSKYERNKKTLLNSLILLQSDGFVDLQLPSIRIEREELWSFIILVVDYIALFFVSLPGSHHSFLSFILFYFSFARFLILCKNFSIFIFILLFTVHEFHGNMNMGLAFAFNMLRFFLFLLLIDYFSSK